MAVKRRTDGLTAFFAALQLYTQANNFIETSFFSVFMKMLWSSSGHLIFLKKISFSSLKKSRFLFKKTHFTFHVCIVEA